MSNLRTVVLAAAAMVVSACAPQAGKPAAAGGGASTATTAAAKKTAADAGAAGNAEAAAAGAAVQPAFPSMPSPAPRTAMSDFRGDGGLLARHQRIVDEVKKGECEIAFIGDSITEGWAGAGKEAWEKTWGPKHAVNCGIGGDRTQHVLGRLDHELLEALATPGNKVGNIVLLIGTNNSGDDTADNIALGVQAITDKLHAKLPAAKITLMMVFPRGQWPNPLRDTIGSLNTRLQQLAAMHPEYIKTLDIHGKFLTAAGEIPKELMPDYLHLSAAGYAIWSEGVEGAFK
jgi:beta-glucosidase